MTISKSHLLKYAVYAKICMYAANFLPHISPNFLNFTAYFASKIARYFKKKPPL